MAPQSPSIGKVSDNSSAESLGDGKNEAERMYSNDHAKEAPADSGIPWSGHQAGQDGRPVRANSSEQPNNITNQQMAVAQADNDLSKLFFRDFHHAEASLQARTPLRKPIRDSKGVEIADSFETLYQNQATYVSAFLNMLGMHPRPEPGSAQAKLGNEETRSLWKNWQDEHYERYSRHRRNDDEGWLKALEKRLWDVMKEVIAVHQVGYMQGVQVDKGLTCMDRFVAVVQVVSDFMSVRADLVDMNKCSINIPFLAAAPVTYAKRSCETFRVTMQRANQISVIPVTAERAPELQEMAQDMQRLVAFGVESQTLAQPNAAVAPAEEGGAIVSEQRSSNLATNPEKEAVKQVQEKTARDKMLRKLAKKKRRERKKRAAAKADEFLEDTSVFDPGVAEDGKDEYEGDNIIVTPRPPTVNKSSDFSAMHSIEQDEDGGLRNDKGADKRAPESSKLSRSQRKYERAQKKEVRKQLQSAEENTNRNMLATQPSDQDSDSDFVGLGEDNDADDDDDEEDDDDGLPRDQRGRRSKQGRRPSIKPSKSGRRAPTPGPGIRSASRARSRARSKTPARGRSRSEVRRINREAEEEQAEKEKRGRDERKREQDACRNKRAASRGP